MESEVDVRGLLDLMEDIDVAWCFPCMMKGTAHMPHADEAAQALPTYQSKPAASARSSFMAFWHIPTNDIATASELLSKPFQSHEASELTMRGWTLVEPENLDIVVVPLVAYDDRGNRLGYGGGNYDRLLPALRPDALVVGVAFEEQRVESVPCEMHDRALAHLVTA